MMKNKTKNIKGRRTKRRNSGIWCYRTTSLRGKGEVKNYNGQHLEEKEGMDGKKR